MSSTVAWETGAPFAFPGRSTAGSGLLFRVSARNDSRPGAAIREIDQGAKTALGVSAPRDVAHAREQTRLFTMAFAAAAKLAAEMEIAGEVHSPDPRIWEFAFHALGPFVDRMATPLFMPLQEGGLSAEWHEKGMNIELRFRGVGDIYVVIEDARGELSEFYGRDPTFRRATSALNILLARAN